MWAAWKKKRAFGFKVALFPVLLLVFLREMFHAWKIWALEIRATDPCWPQHFLLMMSSQLLSSLFLLLCVWGRTGKRKLCSVVTDNCVWMKQAEVCQLTDGCSVGLLFVVWLCCHSLLRGWSQGQWLFTEFFSVPTGHPCPSIIKPTLAWLAGAYCKAWWKWGVAVVECGHRGIGCFSRSAGGLWTG